jgi:hypothetical protein
MFEAYLNNYDSHGGFVPSSVQDYVVHEDPSGVIENVSCSGLNTFMPALPWIRITFGLLMILENSISLVALFKVRVFNFLLC